MKDFKLKENEVVHCKTEKQAKKVLKIFNKKGIKETKTFFNKWQDEKENTCYNFNNGDMLSYSSCEFYKETNYYIVITAKEFLKRHEEPSLKQRIEKSENKPKDEKHNDSLDSISFGIDFGKVDSHGDIYLPGCFSVNKNFFDNKDVSKNKGCQEYIFKASYLLDKKIVDTTDLDNEACLKQRIEKLEAERDHSKKQCELILSNVENKILNYLDHAKKQDDRISKLEKQEKPIEELHAEHRDRREPKVGDVVKAWKEDKNEFIFGVINKIDDDDVPYRLESEAWFENVEPAPEEVVKHFKK